MWAACALLFWWMTVAFSSTCNDLFCLSGCTGQGFLPVLLRGLTAVTTVLLVDGASTQHSCLQFAFNTVGSIQEHWACLPVQSAKKPSCRTCKCVGVWRSPPPPTAIYPGQESLCNGAGPDWSCLLGRCSLEGCLLRWADWVGQICRGMPEWGTQ